jgi:hypothetical protein
VACLGSLQTATPTALHCGNERVLSRDQYNGFFYFALDVIEQRRVGAKFVFFFDKLLLQLRSSSRINLRAEPVAEVPDVVQYAESLHSARSSQGGAAGIAEVGTTAKMPAR